MLGVVQATDFGLGRGIEHGSPLPRRKDRSTGWCSRTPHTQLKLSSHKGSPRAARLGPAVCGPAAAAPAALQTPHPAWKNDPLRLFLCVGGHGARSDAGHCPRAREASADGGVWRHGAARAETSHCNSVSRNSGRGRSYSRWQTTAGSADRDAHEEPEPRAMASQPPATEPGQPQPFYARLPACCWASAPC